MIARFPDSVFSSARSLNSKLNPALAFTPPWQIIHFLLMMGFTSVLKSTDFSEVTKCLTKKTTPIRAITVNDILIAKKLICNNELNHFFQFQKNSFAPGHMTAS